MSSLKNIWVQPKFILAGTLLFLSLSAAAETCGQANCWLGSVPIRLRGIEIVKTDFGWACQHQDGYIDFANSLRAPKLAIYNSKVEIHQCICLNSRQTFAVNCTAE